MKSRKQHVIKTSLELFIDKGYQSTSIQDILDESGISKGTFYNYFSSKGELVKSIFNTLHTSLKKEMNDLLIGQDRADIEIFIKQVELQMKMNRRNKLFSLIEEVFTSHDTDLKSFIKHFQLVQIKWYMYRFIDLFGEEKKPYLLDCAVMFLGILHHHFHFQLMADGKRRVEPLIRYCVNRLIVIVNDAAETREQLLAPQLLDKWLPADPKHCHELKRKTIMESLSKIKTSIDHCFQNEAERSKLIELLEFIQEELMNSNSPRKFVIQSALHSLKINDTSSIYLKELVHLEQLTTEYLG